VSKIVAGARAAGAEAEIIHLGELTIREYDGCHACWRGRDCSKNDDMRQIYPKIITADVIVFGTPVYWYGPTALMKGFMDRFVYFNGQENRPGIRGTRAVVAVVLEEESEATWWPVVDFFDRSLSYLEMVPAGTVVVPGIGATGAIRGHPERLQEAFRLGKTLATDRS